MINEKRLLDNFLAYVQIDSETRNEKNMCDRMVADLQALGFEVQTDKAGEGFGSNGYNVHAYMPGELGGEPTIFRSEERRVGKECRSRWSPYH